MPELLTTLPLVQAWLASGGPGVSSAPPSPQAAALLRTLIAAASGMVLNALNRDGIAPAPFLDTYEAGPSILLRRQPVTRIDSISWFGAVGPLQPVGFGAPGPGYRLEPPQGQGLQRLWLYGGPPRGSEIQVAGISGFSTTDLAQVPDAGSYTTAEVWSLDQGVSYQSGPAMVRVAGAPAQGQYAVDRDGAYTFAPADAEAAVAVSYGYVPADLAQAVTELVGERSKARGRIGISGESLAGKESVTYYSKADMNAYARSSLANWVLVVPC